MKINQNLTFAEIERLYWKTFTKEMPFSMSYKQATEAVEKKLSPMEFSDLLAEIRIIAKEEGGKQ